jgi:beta-N-acetylhexosaminidase
LAEENQSDADTESQMKIIKFLSAIVTLLIVLPLVPFAVDWRAPFLPTVRHLLLTGMIIAPLVVIISSIWLLRSSEKKQRILRALSALGLAIAISVLSITLAKEGHFRWIRHQVLNADSARLEKLGRHAIVGYHNSNEVRELVRLKAVAGIFITGGNIEGRSFIEIQKEISSFQEVRKQQGLARLWIATDQEGGIVSRLSPPLTRMPPLAEIVERNTDMSQLKQGVRHYATKQGLELSELGVNLNFAPVVDLNYRIVNPDDKYSRISRRAISSDPDISAKVADWYCEALEASGVRCTLKHFPGLGRIFEDTHIDHANLTTSIAELIKTDWVPFRTVMSHNKAFVMLGHARLTEIDGDRPVSMSPEVITGLIRNQWNHEGVLITDNFSMLPVYRSKSGMENAAIEALNAGVDLILISYDPDQYYYIMYALLGADEQGRLDSKVLQLSDKRLTENQEELFRKQ